MNKNKKGFAPIVVLIIIAVLVVAFLSTIRNNGDLNKAANDLDGTDITQIDTELNQLTSDASTF